MYMYPVSVLHTNYLVRLHIHVHVHVYNAFCNRVIFTSLVIGFLYGQVILSSATCLTLEFICYNLFLPSGSQIIGRGTVINCQGSNQFHNGPEQTEMYR